MNKQIYDHVEKQFKERARAQGFKFRDPDEMENYLEKQAEYFTGAMAVMVAMIDQQQPDPKKRDYGPAMPPKWIISIMRSEVIGKEEEEEPPTK